MSSASLVELRHWLHANAELSGREHGTAEKIVEFLEPLGPDRLLTEVGGHGVIATFDSGVDGPGLLVRCELDALPIDELAEHDHTSVTAGVAHQCGHDGHMAMVCGLAEHLSARRPRQGAVHLLFQPAEETGTGAAAVLDDPAFADVRPDLGLAIHNMPGFPLGSIVVRPGTLTPAVRSIVFRFTGRTAHASEPELGENPALAIADLVQLADSLSINDAGRDDFRLATTVHVRVGSIAYGVSAGDGELHLTLRAWTDAELADLQDALVRRAEELAAHDRLRLAVETLEDFRSNSNDHEVTADVEAAARAAGLEVILASTPMKAGEDFGLFTSRFPCCMVLLGTGVDAHPLHNPSYDFPDEVIDVGVRLYRAAVDRLLDRADSTAAQR